VTCNARHPSYNRTIGIGIGREIELSRRIPVEIDLEL
jgi:hypothetical protein